MVNKKNMSTYPQVLIPGGLYPGVRPPGAKGGDLHDNPNATFTIYKRDEIRNQFQKYLDEFNIVSKTDITDNDPSSQKEKILLACVRDFVNFEIDFDLFGSVLGMLWTTDEANFNFNYQTEVEELCNMGCELQWYLRNSPEKHISWLTEILEYYKKNQHKISS